MENQEKKMFIQKNSVLLLLSLVSMSARYLHLVLVMMSVCHVRAVRLSCDAMTCVI